MENNLQSDLINGIVYPDPMLVKRALFLGANINTTNGHSALPVYCLLDHCGKTIQKNQTVKEFTLIAHLCVQAGMNMNNKTVPKFYGDELLSLFRSWGGRNPDHPGILYLRKEYKKVNGNDPLT